MSEEKAIRLLTFSGNTTKWKEWKVKFLAKAFNLDYADVLEDMEIVPPDSMLLPNDDAGKLLLKARMANRAAFSALALSCEGTTFGIIEQAMTSKLQEETQHWHGRSC